MTRPTLSANAGSRGYIEGRSGPDAAGWVLLRAGATQSDFDILGDPKVAAEVVALLKERTRQDDAKQSAASGGAS